MLIVLDDGSSGLVACAAGPWERLLARVRAARLDGDLAAGASPDATIELALRAQALVRGRARRDAARAAERILRAAAGDRLPVPVCRDRVRDCSAEISDLISRLLAGGPVSAQGVARAMVLVTDARSPFYHQSSPVDLRAAVRAATDALSPL